MKKKLRKIVIENIEYVYAMDRKNLEREISILTVRVYLKKRKQTPLIIEFKTIIVDYYGGNVLNSGIYLQNDANEIEEININEPQIIRRLILSGLKNGWTGYNEIGIQDGILYLNELGYNTNIIYFCDV